MFGVFLGCQERRHPRRKASANLLQGKEGQVAHKKEHKAEHNATDDEVKIMVLAKRPRQITVSDQNVFLHRKPQEDQPV